MSWDGFIKRCCNKGSTAVIGFITREKTAANAKAVLWLRSEFTAFSAGAFPFERFPMATAVFVVGFIITQLYIRLSLL